MAKMSNIKNKKNNNQVLQKLKTKTPKKQTDEPTPNTIQLAPTCSSDRINPQKPRWTNKQRVLVFGSRGISCRAKHLMTDLRTLMPHSKSDSKFDKNDSLSSIVEICALKNANKCIYFEARKKRDLYMWLASVPQGPTAYMLVENYHTMAELRMSGNCLKSSRPLLMFDDRFSSEPHLQVIKELLTQAFSTPAYHPKSQPFFDHVFSFLIDEDRIWFRNFQIVDEKTLNLVEIGPRFALNPIKIFEGSFGGSVLYSNSNYVSPNEHRRMLRKQAENRIMERQASKLNPKTTGPAYIADPADDVFM